MCSRRSALLLHSVARLLGLAEEIKRQNTRRVTMKLTLMRSCLLGTLAAALLVVAACSGMSGSMPTSPSLSSGARATFETTPTDPCAAPASLATIVEDPPPPPPLCNGRFTGGGFQIDANDLKVTRGFTLHCDELLSNNFEVNYKLGGTAHNFHTDKNPEVTECSKPVVPNPPNADVSRIVIINQPGSLDGVDGHLITIVLEDWGEPGTADRAYIAVDGVALTGGSVLAPALIDGGNIQAHFDQPHK
jgi:hypothetical protein